MKYKRLLHLIKRPQYIFLILGHRGFFKWMKDETYIKIAYWCKMDKRLNLDNPVSYNEKLQWLKLNFRNPEWSKLVDKYEVRKYVASMIGEKYLIPLLGIWDNLDDVDFEKLPNQFVLKCTHDSGGVVLCPDKESFDVKEAKKKLKKSLSQNYYWGQREWIYKNIKPRIIAEKLIVDISGEEIKDYKFFCFDGEVKIMYVASNRSIDTRFDFFDLEFNHLPFMQKYKNSNKLTNKPDGFDKMIKLSEVLSKGIKHVRVDFYEVNGEIYFGEMTFYHFSGWEKFEPEKFDDELGGWLTLPKLEEC